MLEVNLNSPTQLKIINFPDGQHDVVLGEHLRGTNMSRVRVVSRLNSWVDLEIVTCAVRAIRRNFGSMIDLRLPYVLGARSDRVFVEGGNNYLRDVIGPAINSLWAESVEVLDPHSAAMFDAIDNLRLLPNEHFHDSVAAALLMSDAELCVLCPDAGAVPRVEQEDFGRQIIFASKVREASTGKILRTEINGEVAGRSAIIIDDICDGGRTFIELAKVFKQNGGNKLFLAVSHGVFSQGFGELEKYFDHIFCTNSVSDITHPKLTQYKVI